MADSKTDRETCGGTRREVLSDKQLAALLRWPMALVLLPGQIVKFWRNEP